MTLVLVLLLKITNIYSKCEFRFRECFVFNEECTFFYDLEEEKYLLLKFLHSSHLEILLIPRYLGNLVLWHGFIMCLFKYAYFPDTDTILEKTKHKQTLPY